MAANDRCASSSTWASSSRIVDPIGLAGDDVLVERARQIDAAERLLKAHAAELARLDQNHSRGQVDAIMSRTLGRAAPAAAALTLPDAVALIVAGSGVVVTCELFALLPGHHVSLPLAIGLFLLAMLCGLAPRLVCAGERLITRRATGATRGELLVVRLMAIPMVIEGHRLLAVV